MDKTVTMTQVLARPTQMIRVWVQAGLKPDLRPVLAQIEAAQAESTTAGECLTALEKAYELFPPDVENIEDVRVALLVLMFKHVVNLAAEATRHEILAKYRKTVGEIKDIVQGAVQKITDIQREIDKGEAEKN